ncbi:SirB2 family protein [Algibacillus agarilyticus]|uniref:SirB2 family protein n=1 Tax=Algibacillus agarilyticus TaxID=2234133 RepID=UPI000DD0E7A1|nr:SirB2 family protein [Algibacillus agarilyticus]
MPYFAIKHVHMLAVVLSVSLLIFRYVLICRDSAMINKKVLKIMPHVIDTILLVSAFGLMFTIQQYPFQTPWLTEKLLLVIAYIGFGFYTIKNTANAKVRALTLGASIACIAVIIHLAMSKQAFIL